MASNDQHAAAAADHRHAWEVLDEASQVLVRAQSLVKLLRGADDVDEHHRYGASMACDFLMNLKEKLTDAQDLIRPRPDASSP